MLPEGFSKRQLHYIPKDFKVTVWSKLKPYYAELEKRNIDSVEELEQWIDDRSELDDFVSEDFNWRYVKLSCDARNQKYQERYQYMVQEIAPKIAPISFALDKKLLNSPFKSQLNPDKYYIYLRAVENTAALFREENIPLETEVDLLSKEHGAIFGNMTIMWNGAPITIQQASAILEEPDREIRQNIYRLISERIAEDGNQLNDLFDKLLARRHQMALNADFENYRDFKFKALGRFDYTVQDCFDFHEAIEKEVVPLVENLDLDRKNQLGFSSLYPWDAYVDTSGKAPLRPFKDAEELIEKSILCLKEVDPFFAKCLEQMHLMGHLDLESREGKHPGGYNMPLPMTGVPFIFMNAASTIKDVHTMLHEAGHAVHSVLTRDYTLSSAKALPSEIAELASMSMELLTMDHWDVFFENKEDLKRAKIWQLESVLSVLPWIATIDKFQHWLYTHPTQTRKERDQEWMNIFKEFNSKIFDRSDLTHFDVNLWLKQLHIFEVPFYYIEYGIAQLGAIALWKQYRQHPQQAIAAYKKALSLGYTKPIDQVYKAAGIEFSFSANHIKSLMTFVKKELDQLKES